MSEKSQLKVVPWSKINPMFINAIIIDDQQRSITFLQNIMETYCSNVTILGTAKTYENGLQLVNEKRPELIFLDMDLNGKKGLDIIKNADYKDAKIIIISAFENYALEAYDYNTIGYILKPYNVDQVVLFVNKLYKFFNHNTEKSDEILNGFLSVHSLNKIDLVNISGVIMFKSNGRYTLIISENQEVIVSTKHLGDYEILLSNEFFFRVHKSYLINIKKIKSIKKEHGFDCLMSNNELVPIARRKKDQFFDYLNEHCFS